ncbi:MAG: hypothetical protein ACI8UO_000854 [Verrucomicrobiales bacterium]|jgi:hypothetical protein
MTRSQETATEQSEIEPDWEAFGPTIRFLSGALGIRPELGLLYLTSVGGGVSGNGVENFLDFLMPSGV